MINDYIGSQLIREIERGGRSSRMSFNDHSADLATRLRILIRSAVSSRSISYSHPGPFTLQALYWTYHASALVSLVNSTDFLVTVCVYRCQVTVFIIFIRSRYRFRMQWVFDRCKHGMAWQCSGNVLIFFTYHPSYPLNSGYVFMVSHVYS